MNRPGKLLKYSASAGSGKTHALTGFYLSRILHDPGAYRRILAVTFTNAAAAEMKSRILSRLDMLGSETLTPEETNAKDEFINDLCRNFPDLFPDRAQAEVMIRKNAPLAMKNILQDYSRFTVGTIDSFFQRVIRAFAREIDLPAGYEIELEHDILLGNAVDELLYQVSSDTRLRSWISFYVASRLDDNRSWDIRREIMDVSERIFGEEFRQLSDDDHRKISDYELLQQYSDKVFSIKNGFESGLKDLALKGVRLLDEAGLTVHDFLYKNKGGVGDWMKKYSRGQTRPPNTYWMRAMEKSEYLSKDATTDKQNALKSALNAGLDEVVSAIASLFESRYSLYLTALAQVRTIHVIGILGAISEKVRALAHDENLFLLSDSGELISRLISDDDTPFIYEKIGTVYDHYIIDEFQDTSQIQWHNFIPLINETLSRGKDNLVVGDVKQSIYRWRNSDWRIIHTGVTKAFGDDTVRTIPLSKNYRSRMNIIRFNNMIFRPDSAPSVCDSSLDFDKLRLSSVYDGAEQEGTEGKSGGYVRVSLYNKEGDTTWKENVLRDLPGVIEELQDKGYKANDILILCRTNEEGKAIINRILEYSSSCDETKKAGYNFEVTSADSLYLERNPAVTLLLACLRYLVEPQNRVNNSLMVRSFALATGQGENAIYAADMSGELPDNIFFPGWKERLRELQNVSLFVASEKMTDMFRLGESSDNVAYISSFQDVVLWYSSRYSSDIASFLSWWESEGYRKTVAQSDRQEAMRVMTIHKAKGLQGRAVIIPFASWEFSGHGFGKPLLWIKNVPGQFTPMPVVMPELSSQLESSLFSEDAKMERASEWLDGLNMLYVAFTRAIDALYVMAPKAAKPENVTGTTDSILNFILKDGFEMTGWSESGDRNILETGELPTVDRKAEQAVIQMSQYMVSEPNCRLRLRTGGVLPLDDVRIDEPGGRAYGIVMHEILSQINTVEDVGDAVNAACEKGLVNISQRDQLKKKVLDMLSSEKVKEWFDGSCEIRNEAAIILPSGVVRRPDRVMSGKGRVMVLDFKFGEPDSHHTAQAGEYRNLLEKMGHKEVRAWLWYVEKDIITEV